VQAGALRRVGRRDEKPFIVGKRDTAFVKVRALDIQRQGACQQGAISASSPLSAAAGMASSRALNLCVRASRATAVAGESSGQRAAAAISPRCPAATGSASFQ
jgi:hypothetical protein